jgi:hypothetical protein
VTDRVQTSDWQGANPWPVIFSSPVGAARADPRTHTHAHARAHKYTHTRACARSRTHTRTRTHTHTHTHTTSLVFQPDTCSHWTTHTLNHWQWVPRASTRAHTHTHTDLHTQPITVPFKAYGMLVLFWNRYLLWVWLTGPQEWYCANCKIRVVDWPCNNFLFYFVSIKECQATLYHSLVSISIIKSYYIFVFRRTSKFTRMYFSLHPSDYHRTDRQFYLKNCTSSVQRQDVCEKCF